MINQDIRTKLQQPPAELGVEAEAVRLSFKHWWTKLDSISSRGFAARAEVYISALRNLPGSYKLWYNFLRELLAAAAANGVEDEGFVRVEEVFEQCLVFMHKMPRIWIMFFEHVKEQGFLTKTRKILDRVILEFILGFKSSSSYSTP